MRIDPTTGADPLAGTDWANWVRIPIAGDASARRYWRIKGPAGKSAILLDNGAPHGAGIDAFLDIGTRLRHAGLAAPEVHHLSADHRFAILQDLGSATVSAHLQHVPPDENRLYAGAADLIVAIQAIPAPAHCKILEPETAADMLDPFFDHAARDTTPGDARAMRDAIREGVAALATGPCVLSLRDFHGENLIWRPEETGLRRYGLIDFQDAFLAPAEYDLASLLRDPRRDVSPEASAHALQRAAQLGNRPVSEIEASVAILALQRNLRIIGIFHNLIRNAGKPRYRAFLPRLQRLIDADLRHPALAPFAGPIRNVLSGIQT